MPEQITGETTDGIVLSYLQGSWSDVRVQTGAQHSYYDSNTRDTIQVNHSVGMRGTSFGLVRAFFDFDTSGITDTVSEAFLRIHGWAKDDLDVIAVKSDQGSGLSTADWQAIRGAEEEFALSDGSGAGTLNGATGVTVYSAKFTSWDIDGLNSAAITVAGLADMRSEDNFRFCLMDYDYDFLDIEPPEAQLKTGLYWEDESNEELKPRIDYTLATAVTDNATFFGANF